MRGLCENYEQWKHCITVECHIPLTPEYVASRIAALRDERDPTTARFVALYGDSYRLRTVGWFEQARAELAGTPKS
ncbi:MAG: hypothetical protein AAF500_05615 [Myxococcota bacterium]